MQVDHVALGGPRPLLGLVQHLVTEYTEELKGVHFITILPGKGGLDVAIGREEKLAEEPKRIVTF